MILIDIPMPPGCADCPCSHLITSGILAGRTMCAARQAQIRWLRAESLLIDETGTGRPRGCPIKGEIPPQKEEKRR